MNGKGIVKKGLSVTGRIAGIAATVGAIIVSSVLIASAGGYTITDLGTLPGGTETYVASINNSGQAVGEVYSAGNDTANAVLFSNGTVTSLGNGMAFGINNVGQAVGQAYYTSTASTQATLFYNGQNTNLGTLHGYAFSVANSINDLGQAVGTAISTNSHYTQAVLFSNGIATALGILPGGHASYAYSINNSGQAVGYSTTSIYDGPSYATLYSNGQITNLGGLGGSQSAAYSINNSGQAVGFAYTGGDNGTAHAALFSNGKVVDLGTLPGEGNNFSFANSINNSGIAVGYAQNYSPTGVWGTGRAVMYSNGTATDLNSLVDAANGWTLTYASDINELGQIVGKGILNGHETAFLLTPDSATPTPIPAASLLFGSGLMGLLGLRRREKMLSV
jgi:probable HAF family extracellular repeat protein